MSKEKIQLDCPFCGEPAEWVQNKEIYGKNYGESYMCWLCRPCDAYVGCHQNTRRPLGTIANKETREWRKKAHAEIDPHWRDDFCNRDEVYIALSRELGREVHVGESNIEQCKEIIEASKKLFNRE